MLQRRHGHIITIASLGGRVASPGGATYAASKHAVVGFSEAMRLEVGTAGVHVSCVLPIVVATELSAGIATVPGVRRVSPEEVAATVVRVARAPRPETWVPRWPRALVLAVSLLPYRLEDRVMRGLGQDILQRSDRAARAAYERRARGELQRRA